MKRTPKLRLLLVVALAFAFSFAFAFACASNSDNDQTPIDGDQNVNGDEDLPVADGDQSADGDTPECPDGQVWSNEDSACVVPPKCPPGMEWIEDSQSCAFVKPITCDHNDFAKVYEGSEVNTESDKPDWFYRVINAEEVPVDILYVQHYGSKGGATEPGTYDLTEDDTSWDTCKTCLLIRSDCSVSELTGDLVCNKTFMPMAEGSVTFTKLGLANGEDFAGSLNNVTFQEVEISPSDVATPVKNGEHWCLEKQEWDLMLASQGYVDMDERTDLSCDYPAGPYYILGPEPGHTEPAPSTVPPMAWPSAYKDGEVVGLDLGQFRCDHPEIKTLFLFLSAGWCPYCTTKYTAMCEDGAEIDQLQKYDSEFLWVVGEGPLGNKIGSDGAESRVNRVYGCTEGYRISDDDNSAGEPVLWENTLQSGIPWMAAIRMSDMKLTHSQSSTAYLDLLYIARTNCDAAGGCTGVEDGDTDSDMELEAEVEVEIDGDSELEEEIEVEVEAEAEIEVEAEAAPSQD